MGATTAAAAAAAALSKLLPALALPPKLEPYKKLLGVLVRKNCISVAVSNPYLNLAEPLGAVMLREGRLPGRSFQRLLAEQQQELAGFVLAYELAPDAPAAQAQLQQPAEQQPGGLTQQQESAAAQVQAALESMRPGLLGGWYGGWSQEAAGASCRILPPVGPSAAATADVKQAAASMPATSSSSSSQSSNQPGAASPAPLCSLGQQFLQTYLDSLGSLNTFG